MMIPAGAQGTATGTCTPGYQNGKRVDINLIASSPPMHKAGVHMNTCLF